MVVSKNRTEMHGQQNIKFCLQNSCLFNFAFLMCKNLISWLSRKSVAARTVFLSRRLLLLILMDMCVEVSCFDLQVLLNQLMAIVLCGLCFRLLYSRISFPCLALACFNQLTNKDPALITTH